MDNKVNIRKDQPCHEARDLVLLCENMKKEKDAKNCLENYMLQCILDTTDKETERMFRYTKNNIEDKFYFL